MLTEKNLPKTTVVATADSNNADLAECSDSLEDRPSFLPLECDCILVLKVNVVINIFKLSMLSSSYQYRCYFVCIDRY